MVIEGLVCINKILNGLSTLRIYGKCHRSKPAFLGYFDIGNIAWTTRFNFAMDIFFTVKKIFKLKSSLKNG